LLGFKNIRPVTIIVPWRNQAAFMKVLLIFPPLWAVHRPYLSLPSLTAYLKASDIDVVQKDFNIEAYDLLVSEHYLKTAAERLEKKFRALDAQDKLSAGMEQQLYYSLFKARSNIDYIAGKVEGAKSILRNKNRFYDLQSYLDAKNIIVQAQTLISVDCFPAGGDLVSPVNMQLKRTFPEIKALVQSPDENPFIGLYQQYLLPFITGTNPDVIGISISGERQLVPGLTLSHLIKSTNPQVHVTIGGYTVTQLSQVLSGHKELFTGFFDSAIVFQGERPLLELVDAIARDRPLESVPNLIYHDRGKIRSSAVLPAEDIDTLPTPCFDGLPLEQYLSPEPVLPLLTSRGCYWGKCAFCSHNESYRWSYQKRDPVKVVDDMRQLSEKHRVRHFAFSDEAISPSAMKQITDEILNRRLDVRCSTNIRLERQFTSELCSQMYRAGFRVLHLGLESGCDRVLEHMQKGTTRHSAREVLQNTARAGLWNHVYVFFGFPTETEAEAGETAEFLISNRDYIHSFGVTSFILNKGSAAMNNPGHFGIARIDADPAGDFNLDYAYTVSSGLSSEQARLLADNYREKITAGFPYPDRMKLYYEDILLYLSYYHDSDPWLKKLAKKSAGAAPAVNRFTRKSVPVLRPHVLFEPLRFDIIDIIVNKISKNSTAAACPARTCVVSDPVSGKLISISPLEMDVLGLCNGKNSIKQIAAGMSRQYDSPASRIEPTCIDSLRYLAEQGYINFRPEPSRR